MSMFLKKLLLKFSNKHCRLNVICITNNIVHQDLKPENKINNEKKNIKYKLLIGFSM